MLSEGVHFSRAFLWFLVGDYNVKPSLVHSTFRTDPAALPATGLQPRARLRAFVVEWLSVSLAFPGPVLQDF